MSVDFYSNSKIRDPSEINAVDDNTHDPDELGQLCFVSFNFSMKIIPHVNTNFLVFAAPPTLASNRCRFFLELLSYAVVTTMLSPG